MTLLQGHWHKKLKQRCELCGTITQTGDNFVIQTPEFVGVFCGTAHARQKLLEKGIIEEDEV